MGLVKRLSIRVLFPNALLVAPSAGSTGRGGAPAAPIVQELPGGVSPREAPCRGGLLEVEILAMQPAEGEPTEEEPTAGEPTNFAHDRREAYRW